MNKLLVAAVTTALTLTATHVANTTNTKPIEHDTYPTAMVVCDVDHNTDTVTAQTWTGIVYKWYGVEDWMEGDIAACIMDDNGTPNTVFDDQIIETRYVGWVR